MNNSDTTTIDPKTHPRAGPWADLVVAMLSANNYPLAKTFTLVDSLDSNGLFNISNYAIWDQSEITRRLAAAGYDRGPRMTQIFVDRLASLSTLVDDLAGNEEMLSKGSRDQVATLLQKIRGVGPTVLANFFLLRE